MVTIIPSVKSKDPTSCSIVQGEKCPTSLDSHSFPTRASFPPHILCKVLRVTRFPSGFHGEELGSSLLFRILTSAGSVSLYPSFLRTPLSSLSWDSFFSLFFSDSNSTQAKLYLDLLGKSGSGQQDHGLICLKWNHLTDKHWIPSARHYDRNQRCIRGTRSEPGKQPAVLGLAEKIPQVP